MQQIIFDCGACFYYIFCYLSSIYFFLFFFVILTLLALSRTFVVIENVSYFTSCVYHAQAFDEIRMSLIYDRSGQPGMPVVCTYTYVYIHTYEILSAAVDYRISER